MNRIITLIFVISFTVITSCTNNKRTSALSGKEDYRNYKDVEEEDALPTKYATILYVNKVVDTIGNNEPFAAHFRNVGGGKFTWKEDIKKAGSYKVNITYATTKKDVNVGILSKKDTLRAHLLPTEGYFPKQKGQSNFNRKRVSGEIRLDEGDNSISLQIITKRPSDDVIIHSLELIPCSERKSMEEDWERAEGSHERIHWFENAPYGVMFHWTSEAPPERGLVKPYDEAAEEFDVKNFGEMVKEMGASYVIFTTNHAENYFPAPLKSWEDVFPGHTSSRDLVDEIADELAKNDIKLILYLNSYIYGESDKIKDTEFKRRNLSFIKEIGERYGEKVVGYWFDSWYQAYEEHPDFDFEEFYKVCKEGNPNRLVTFNSWIYPIVSLWQDYWAGEVYTLGIPPVASILKNGPGKGLQSQNLIVMEQEGWYHTAVDTTIPEPSVTPEDLVDYILKSEGKGPLTINMQVYQDGTVTSGALEVMKRVKEILH